MKKKHVILIVIFGIILLIIGILSPLFLNKPAQNDLYNFDKYINVAQSFSGYMMPFIALLGALLTFAAFYIQYKANERIRKQFDLEQSNAHFYRMLDIHINNVKEFEISSSYENLSESSETNYSREKFILKQKDKSEIKHRNIERVNTKGRLCFVLMVKDLHFTIEMVKSENQNLVKKLEPEMLLKVAYRIFFWGTNSHHRYPKPKGKIDADNKANEKSKELLTEEQVKSIDTINKKLDGYRDILRKKYKGQSFSQEYTVNNNKKVKINFRFIPMSGHSTRLAHYFRHLYQTAKHIYKTSNHQEKEFLQPDEIDFRFSTLRAQMSNEEQLLLYYNYRIGFGAKWDKRYDSDVEGSDDYLFLSKYKMIHNIPLYDTIHHLVEHPEKHFKKFTDKHPSADLFEWS